MAVLEGDDFWIDPLKLQRQVNYLNTYDDCNICATQVLQWVTDGVFASRINPSKKITDFRTKDILDGNGGIVNTCAFVFRRGRFPDPMKWSSEIIGGDWALLAGALNDGSYCRVLPVVTAVYRIHSKGVWRGEDRTKIHKLSIVLSYLHAYKLIANQVILRELNEKIRYYELVNCYYSTRKWGRWLVVIRRILSDPALVRYVLRSIEKKLKIK